MSAVELIQVMAALLGAVMTIIAGADQKIVKLLKNKNALSEKSAVKFERHKPLFRWRVNRLKALNALRMTRSGTIYFDETTYKQVIKKRVWSVILFIIIALGLILTLYYVI